ncbi:hypothetical protein U5A82_06120 [Sphingobium sp. CR2-8]|uniref:HNH endonuclease n=1 Tax=Sphingobium sp. CR2-8 TaxID=1306534 RepID=UPI002DB9E90A|nr:hypothetical protein [Sphingobium sp. CR2-8]MEC3910065.1 hypothetical protein [Sphingobium sp. CR2-8]
MTGVTSDKVKMPTPIVMRTAAGQPLNARVEADEQGIIVHSRSGVDRNRDYREAMELLLTRLDKAGHPYEAYLDSAPVHHLPLNQRRLAFPRSGPVEERFNPLVRAMNANSSSNGARRRVLFVVAGLTRSQLVTVANGTGDLESASVSRLPTEQLRKVTAEHVDKAVARLLKGDDAPNFAPSRDFDLLGPSDERLAPKKVFGFALEQALGIVAFPGHFSAGLGTPCFQILEAAGYPIVTKGQAVTPPSVPVDPDLAAAEGNQRLVTHLKRERRPALAAAKRRAMIDQLGYLQCERCKMVPSQELGQHGDAVIEVHHAKVQVAAMAMGHVTRLADLMCLCANCHRITHREIAAA